MPARAFRIRGTALPITGKPGRSKSGDSASLVSWSLGGVGVISVTAVVRTTGVGVGVSVGGGCVGVGRAIGVGVTVGVGVGVLVGTGVIVGVGVGVLVGVGVGVLAGAGMGVFVDAGVTVGIGVGVLVGVGVGIAANMCVVIAVAPVAIVVICCAFRRCRLRHLRRRLRDWLGHRFRHLCSNGPLRLLFRGIIRRHRRLIVVGTRLHPSRRIILVAGIVAAFIVFLRSRCRYRSWRPSRDRCGRRSRYRRGLLGWFRSWFFSRLRGRFFGRFGVWFRCGLVTDVDGHL